MYIQQNKKNMKATKDQQWKAQIDRAEIQDYIRILTKNLSRLDLEDSDDTVALKGILRKVATLNKEVSNYMFNAKNK